MPKIIENGKERLMEAARTELALSGYASMNIRSIAQRAQMAPSTVYNYFSSKEEILACCLLDDWKSLLSQMTDPGTDALERCQSLYAVLAAFIDDHRILFSDGAAKEAYSRNFLIYHSRFRDSISSFLIPMLHDEMLAKIVTDILICQCCENASFANVAPYLARLVRKSEYEQF